MLFFLAPAVGELLSGSSPPLKFFNPFERLMEAFLYGSGALLAREFTLRWRRGWPTLLALGADGLDVHSLAHATHARPR